MDQIQQLYRDNSREKSRAFKTFQSHVDGGVVMGLRDTTMGMQRYLGEKNKK